MKIPIYFAIFFSVVDIVWLLLLDIHGWSISLGYIVFQDMWWDIGDRAMMLWNQIHFPTRYFIEPILFPVVTFHPLSISSTTIFIYQTLCVLQSTITGFILGILVQIVRRRHN